MLHLCRQSGRWCGRNAGLMAGQVVEIEPVHLVLLRRRQFVLKRKVVKLKLVLFDPEVIHGENFRKERAADGSASFNERARQVFGSGGIAELSRFDNRMNVVGAE